MNRKEFSRLASRHILAGILIQKGKNRKTVRRNFISVLTAVAVLASILTPAVLMVQSMPTARADLECSHIHSEECGVIPEDHVCSEEADAPGNPSGCTPIYPQITVVTKPGHTHSDGCYATIPGHTHDGSCYDSESGLDCSASEGGTTDYGNLICDLEETPDETAKIEDTDASPIGWICRAEPILICQHKDCKEGMPCLIETEDANRGEEEEEEEAEVGEAEEEDDEQAVMLAPLAGGEPTSEEWFKMSADGKTITLFYYKANLSPTEIVIPAVINGITVKAIGAGVFASAHLTSVEFEDGGQIETIGNNAFQNNPISAITLPDTVESLGNYAFSDCKQLQSADLGNSLISLGTYAFKSCAALKSIALPDTLTYFGERVFDSCSGLTTVVLGDSLSKIGGYAFYGCSALQTINIPDTLTVIEGGAFYGCSKLQSIDLSGTTLTEVQQSTFYNCKMLTSVQLPYGLATIGSSAFYSTALAYTSIPDTVTTIGTSAFYSLPANSVIDLSGHDPSSIAGAPWNAFNSIIRWKPDPDNLDPIFLFDTSRGLIYGLKEGYTGNGNITIPLMIDGTRVNEIAGGAFGSRPANQKIKVVDFAEGLSIAEIPEYTFYYCAYLASVKNLPASVQTIGQYAFSNSRITSIVLPDGITNIGHSAFRICQFLTTVTLPAALQTIEPYTFESCVLLKSIAFPATLQMIENNAFAGCSVLATVTLTDGITSIGNAAFKDCRALTSVVFPASVQAIKADTLRNCTALLSVTFEGDAITGINTSAFMGTTALKDIYLLEKYYNSVEGAPWNATGASVHWKDVIVPAESVVDDTGLWQFNTKTKTITKYLGTVSDTTELTVPSLLYFYNMPFSIVSVLNSDGIIPAPKQLKSLKISDGIITIGSFVFQHVSIGSLDLGRTVENIRSQSFQYCELTSLTLPRKIKIIDSSAFANNALTGEINIPGNMTSNDYLKIFSGNDGILQITIEMYRTQASDPGGYDPIARKYNKAPSDLVLKSTLGAPPNTPVYFMDDQRPLYSHTIKTYKGTEGNFAAVDLSVIMSDDSKISSIGSYNNKQPVTQNISKDSAVHSTARMIIDPANGDGNGVYTFETKPERHLPNYYSVTVDVFSSVKYHGNGNTGGVAPTGGVYVLDYPLTLANHGTLEKDGYAFVGWNTQADGKGRFFAAGSVMTIESNADLYAVWRDPNQQVPTFLVAPEVNYGLGTLPTRHTLFGLDGSKIPAAFSSYVVNSDAENAGGRMFSIEHPSAGQWSLMLKCTPFIADNAQGATPVAVDNSTGETKMDAFSGNNSVEVYNSERFALDNDNGRITVDGGIYSWSWDKLLHDVKVYTTPGVPKTGVTYQSVFTWELVVAP